MLDFLFSKHALGGIAASMVFVSYLPYIASVLWRKTRPHAFSWIIWGLVTAVGAAVQLFKQAGAGAWPVAASAVFCMAIAVLSLFYGEKRITRGDWIMFGLALAAIPLWYFTADPLWSLLLIIGIDGAAFYMTFRKSWLKPREEMAYSYFCYAASLVLSLFALERYNLYTLLYPVLVLAANAGIGIMLVWRRRVVKQV